MLRKRCFFYSGIRRLVLPSSVRIIDAGAFTSCGSLEYADLSAGRNVRTLESGTFLGCKKLRYVLLNDGLETIGCQCFSQTGLEEVVIPGSVKCVGGNAFYLSMSLKCVRFLGSSENMVRSESKLQEKYSSCNTEKS